MLSVRRDAVRVVSSGARDYKALDSKSTTRVSTLYSNDFPKTRDTISEMTTQIPNMEALEAPNPSALINLMASADVSAPSAYRNASLFLPCV